MMKQSKDVLFFVETESQYESIKPLLVHVKEKSSISFDIAVPSSHQTPTEEIFDSTASVLANDGFKVVRGADEVILPKDVINTHYKVLLSAYMYDWHYDNLSITYRIMFPYASYYFNKPNWTLSRFISNDYMADALISHATGTKQVTDIFTKTYVLPSLKLMSFKKNVNKSKKPVILFAPTYNETDVSSSFIDAIDLIKKKYALSVRIHRRDSSKDSKGLNELYEKADKIYNTEKHSLVSNLEEVDLVISDNSAVLFDAISCGIQVAVFCRDPNLFKYREINTMQYELIKSRDILWAKEPEKIPQLIDKSLRTDMIIKQKKMKDRLFEYETGNPLEAWLEVLMYYINGGTSQDYILAKRYWVESIHGKMETVPLSDFKALEKRLEESNRQVHSEQNPGVITASKRLLKATLSRIGLSI